MARRTVTIDEKIDRQKQVVSKYKARYEAELEVLERLMQIRDEELGATGDGSASPSRRVTGDAKPSLSPLNAMHDDLSNPDRTSLPR